MRLFGPGTVTLTAAIPYSWQAGRIRTGRLIENLKEIYAHMTTITRTRFYLPLAGMMLAAALALPAAAQQEVPFKGTFQGSDNVAPPTLTQSIAGTGTHVGEFSSTTVLTLRPSGGSGIGRWIAANGDTIETAVVGSLEHVPMAPCPVLGAQPDDAYAKITQIHTITGGTGRFAGVQGSFTLTLYHDVSLSSDGTHHTCGSYSGTITPPGAAR